MNSDLKRILQLVEAKEISPAEGQRRLRELRAGAAAGTPAVSAGPGPSAPADGVPAPAAPTATSPAGAARRIAVIGLSCRFPGGETPEQFWRSLADGVCSVGEVPAERWDADLYYDPDPRVPGRTNSRWGGFIADPAAFDPLFFNLSGREAELADPQQRLFLEGCWTALEDAGYAGDAVSGLNCGVFAGSPASDYPTDSHRSGADADAQVLLGNDTAILAARISYLLNLRGPSMALNTACSSSLVALHLAVRAIESGECEMALAGGVCLFVGPGFHLSAGKGGMLSPEGLCKAFDATADGFVPGDGVGVVVLKDLDAAIRDGDHVRGVILGVGTNQDGRTNGITAPSAQSQTALQLSVYRRAGIDPSTISLVEAHGTGTPLGDPIEIQALSRSFAEYTDRKQFCAIGSVKTNIGHTGQAAGMAGLIKTLLAFEHELIPPSLHFETENERIGFAGTPFHVVTESTPWPRREGAPRRAALNAFGYSGTNAHVVVEEPPVAATAPADGSAHLVLVSARTAEALDRRLADLDTRLGAEGDQPSLADIAYTLHAGRKHFSHRAAFAARDAAELREAIQRRRSLPGERPVPLRAAEHERNLQSLRDELAPAGERRAVLERAAGLYERGLPLPVDLFFPGGRGRRVPLPTYPFARDRYWLEGAAQAATPADRVSQRDSLVPEPLADGPDGELRFRFRLAADGFLVADHVIEGKAVLAGMVSLEMARTAGSLAGRGAVARISGVTWHRPLPADAPAGLEVRLVPAGAELRYEIRVHGDPDAAPGATGTLHFGPTAHQPAEPVSANPGTLSGSLTRVVTGEECYRRFEAMGFTYGPGFRVVSELRSNARQVLSRLRLTPELAADLSGYGIHPALFDGALQSLIGLDEDGTGGRRVPFALDEVVLHAPLVSPCHAHLVHTDDGTIGIRLADEADRPLASLRGLTVAATAPAAPAAELLRHRPVWRAAEIPARATEPGPVLVLDLDGRAAATLRTEHPGDTVVLATPAGEFHQVDDRNFAVDPSSVQDYRRLLTALRPSGTPRTILMLWGAGRSVHDGGAPETDRNFHALLALVRALGEERGHGPATIRIAHPVDGATALPQWAALGAFARTARLENPDLRIRTIGLPAGTDLTDGRSPAWNLLLAASFADEPVELRLRPDGTAESREFEEIASTGSPAITPVVRAGGTYLVTGGAGHLGRTLARHLASRQANVVLVGRSEPGPELAAELRETGSGGAAVVHMRADVTDPVALERVLAETRSRFGGLHGVIHAAGAVRDSFLIRKTPETAREVLAPKVDGAVLLDRLTREDPLDFMVFCSSVVGSLGNIGQADYAYANAFLDELAAVRENLRAGGLRRGATVSIGWPAWAGGMGAAVEAERSATGRAVAALTADEGLAAFDEALTLGEPRLLLVKGRPAEIRAALRRGSRDAAAPDGPAGGCDELRAPAVSVLRQLLAEELRLPADRIDPAAPFEDFGIDSVLVMRLSARLEDEFGALPKTLFFQYQSLDELAGYFAERHGEALRRRLPNEPAEPAAQTATAPQATTTPTRAGTPTPAATAPPAGHRTDDIAVIGVSGRYPMAENLDEFWRNLSGGRDCVSEIPADRWPLDGFYDPEGGAGLSYSKWGGFLKDIDKFDPLFFNIAPREADMMDPQERLFLQTVWHVLEDAGYTRATLRGGRTGVFVGVMYGEYQLLGAAEDGRMPVSSYASIANRASYFFGFQGPSIALDTMCSSSLTAIHLACESLRRGESTTAVAGGVNLSLHPNKYRQLSLTRFAASDGRCRSFGADGDGYVPGEGVGALLLKPLAAALADGDTVHAVIRAGAINHGGKTNGYTVPNPKAQTSVIAEALRGSGTNPSDIGYVEAHGTGTALGDPIEVAALTDAFGERPTGSGRIPIGSVKSAIGHLESAAGIAAVTKVILQLRHRTLVPSLHSEPLNPHLDLDGSPFHVQRELTAWELPPSGPGRRIAGISSFGAGGANAHLVLAEHPAPQPADDPLGPQVLVVSAKTPERLREAAARLAVYLDSTGGAPGADAAGDRLVTDLLGRVRGLLGLRDGDLLPDDSLRESGMDEVARAALGTAIAQSHRVGSDELPDAVDSVAELAAWLIDRQGDDLSPHVGPTGERRPRLADVAYTLQTGREAMPERLAFVVESLDAAVERLRAFAAGEEPEGPLHLGTRTTTTPSPAAKGTESPESLARLWTEGAEIDWHGLHAGAVRHRISLPGYPFARDRHWLEPARSLPQPPARRPETEEPKPSMTPTPSAAPVADIRSWLVRDLVALAAPAIGIDPARLEPGTALGEFGFESMSLKSLADTIADRFRVSFSPAVLFERTGIDGAVDWLLDEYGDEIEATVRTLMTAPPAAPPAPAASAPSPAPATGSVSAPAPAAVVPAPGPAPASILAAGAAGEGSGEPIAIIGMSGRFPGSPDLAAFWDNLRERRNLVTEVPADRWDWREQGADLSPEYRRGLRWGAFIDDADRFDPLFFGISPVEAELMDPQQRLLLQAAWEAIEDAGYRASEFAGKDVGLFAGIQFSDYQHLLHEAGLLNVQVALGNEHAIAVNRISYLLDLRGPSEPVNTACSSSLVAIHRAVRSLRSGESTLAIAGGIGLNLAPHSAVADAAMGVLSPDGRTRTLDRGANGFAKGEGLGVVLLKPLSRAVADGDRICAVIRGTAVNHGGRAASLTAPNSEAQAALLRTAVEEAGVSPESIGYLELHGTGTELGDPVEVNGIKSAFRKLARARGGKPATGPHCGIGSVKTNLGHLEPASGMAGLLKVVLALKHRTLPGMAHFDELNPYVDLDRSPFHVVADTVPWQRTVDGSGRELPLRAGVNAFGFGGVNAHVLLEEYRADEAAPAGSVPEGDRVFVFSARNAAALDRTVTRFLERLTAWEAAPDTRPGIDTVAFTLQEGREAFDERLAVVASGFGVLSERLAEVARGDLSHPQVFRDRVQRRRPAESEAAEPVLPAQEWVLGGDVDWAALRPAAAPGVPLRTALPTYPFESKRYWFNAPAAKAGAARAAVPGAAAPAPTAEAAVEPAAVSAPVRATVPADAQAAVPADASIEDELRELLVEQLKLSAAEMDGDRTFREMGVDSLLSVGIMQSVQDRFGSQVPFSALVEYPTLRSLAEFIGAEFPRPGRGPATPPPISAATPPARAVAQPRLPAEIIPLNAGGSRQPSFWVPGAAGYAASVANLARALGPEYPFYAFQTRGTDGHSMPQMLDEMVDHYIACVRMVQPEGPYVLGGYSFGGLVAMEMARRLEEQGEEIRHLIMFDTYPATQEVFDRHNDRYDDDFMQFYMTNYFLDLKENPELAIGKEDVAHLPRSLQLMELARLAKERSGRPISADDIYLYLRGGLICAEHSAGLYQTYEMRPYTASDVTFFKAGDGFTGQASEIYWRRTQILDGYDYLTPWRELIAGEFRVTELDSDHLNMLEEPTLSVALRQIEQALKEQPAINRAEQSRFEDALEQVTGFGRRLLADRLLATGALPAAGESITRAALSGKLDVRPEHEALFRADLDILTREGLLAADDEQVTVNAELAGAAFPDGEAGIKAEVDRLTAEHPGLAGHITLLTESQAALPDILAGHRDTGDLLRPYAHQPAGARGLGSPLGAYCDRVTAELIEERVGRSARRFRYSTVQVLETGTGSRSLTEPALRALKAHADRVRYFQTDSRAEAVREARRLFAAEYPFAEFAPYAVEKRPDTQGFEPHTLDLVVIGQALDGGAPNEDVLEQCRRLLKPGGTLVINEATRSLDFHTLTARTPATVLPAADWLDALSLAGFEQTEVHGLLGADLSDHAHCVITAVSGEAR
ncbi:SDR family NAD(P)-dependent oxidoreductase [Streptomyces sp. NPDC001933]|uniref:SDR family NAD(P)-dependent oxidoreductase n=1 Tax=Streptomyces sp. NPDC001933 TaxID=3364626 RepID=UPI0036C70BFD